jgi:hypothetical protein
MIPYKKDRTKIALNSIFIGIIKLIFSFKTILEYFYNSIFFIFGTKRCIISQANKYAPPQIKNMMK